MTIKADLTVKRCFMACAQEKIDSGQCTCINRANINNEATIEMIPYHLQSDRNWEEDYIMENGCYMNSCNTCKNTFLGYKRRVRCKACAVNTKPND